MIKLIIFCTYTLGKMGPGKGRAVLKVTQQVHEPSNSLVGVSQHLATPFKDSLRTRCHFRDITDATFVVGVFHACARLSTMDGEPMACQVLPHHSASSASHQEIHTCSYSHF